MGNGVHRSVADVAEAFLRRSCSGSSLLSTTSSPALGNLTWRPRGHSSAAHPSRSPAAQGGLSTPYLLGHKSSVPGADCPGLRPRFTQTQVLPRLLQLPAVCPHPPPSSAVSPLPAQDPSRRGAAHILPSVISAPALPQDPRHPHPGHQPGALLCTHRSPPIPPAPPLPRPAALQLHTRAAKLTGNPVVANPGSCPCQEFELQSQEGSRLQARRPPRSSHCPASETLFRAGPEEAPLTAGITPAGFPGPICGMCPLIPAGSVRSSGGGGGAHCSPVLCVCSSALGHSCTCSAVKQGRVARLGQPGCDLQKRNYRDGSLGEGRAEPCRGSGPLIYERLAAPNKQVGGVTSVVKK